MAASDPKPLPSTRRLLTSLISTIATSTQQQGPSEATSNPLATAVSQNTKLAFLTLHSLFPHDFLPALDLLDRGLVTRFVTTAGEESPEQHEQLAPHLGDGDENTTHCASSEIVTRQQQHPERNLQEEETQTEPQAPPSSQHHQQHHQPQPEDNPSVKNQNQNQYRKRNQTILYQVRSSTQRAAKTSSAFRSDHHPASHTTTTTTTAGASYEVRLKAWNCSCPAFAFAALPASSEEDSGSRDDDGVGGDGDEADDGGYGLSAGAASTASTAAAHDGGDAVAWLGFGGLARGGNVPVCKHLLACVVAERCSGFERLVGEREVGVEEVAGWAAG